MARVILARLRASNAPAEQWEQDYGFVGYASDSVNCLIQTNDGGYAFVGISSLNSLTDTLPGTTLVKTDSSGTERWQKQFGFTGALGLVQTSDGGYVLAGQDNASSGTVLFKLDQAAICNGTKLIRIVVAMLWCRQVMEGLH